MRSATASSGVRKGERQKKKRRMYEDCIGTIDKVHTNAKMNEI